MKLWNHLIFVAVLTILAPSFVYSQSVQQAGLDEVIQNAAKKVEEGMPQGTMIAVLNFTSTSETFSDYVVEELTGELVRGRKLTIVDRRRLALIRQEMNLQLSGEVSDESASAIGRQLGAQSIVSGSLTNMGTYFRFRVSVINVETSAIEYQISLNLRSDPQVTFLLSSSQPRVASNAQTNTAPAAQAGAAATTPSAAAAPIVYKIGDKGPAGGWIFYDKGVVTNGWRYMEAAPNDIGPAQWGAQGTAVSGTSTAAGTGKANTQRIIPVLNQAGDDGAALLCTAMNINGYKDWFLPSKDELNLMYTNLKAKGLGGFGSGRYWASSEGNSSVYANPSRYAWTQNFSNGSQNDWTNGGEKNNTHSVRAVRAF